MYAHKYKKSNLSCFNICIRLFFCSHELLLDENSLLFTVCIQSHANNTFNLSSINKSRRMMTLKSLKHYIMLNFQRQTYPCIFKYCCCLNRHEIFIFSYAVNNGEMFSVLIVHTYVLL